MSPKDFFRIVIKILALLLISNGLIPALANFYNWFDVRTNVAFILLGISLLFVALIYIAVFYTDFIIKLLKLDSGFDAENFNLNNSSDAKTIQLACIIIGLYMAVSSLPLILHEIILNFKREISSSMFQEFGFENDYYFYTSIIHLMVGLLMVTLRKQISRMFTTTN